MVREDGFLLKCKVTAYVRSRNVSGFPDKEAVKALLHKLVDSDAVEYICTYGVWEEVE